MLDKKCLKLSILSAVVFAAFVGIGVGIGTRGDNRKDHPVHSFVDESRGPHDLGDDALDELEELAGVLDGATAEGGYHGDRLDTIGSADTSIANDGGVYSGTGDGNSSGSVSSYLPSILRYGSSSGGGGSNGPGGFMEGAPGSPKGSRCRDCVITRARPSKDEERSSEESSDKGSSEDSEDHWEHDGWTTGEGKQRSWSASSWSAPSARSTSSHSSSSSKGNKRSSKASKCTSDSAGSTKSSKTSDKAGKSSGRRRLGKWFGDWNSHGDWGSDWEAPPSSSSPDRNEPEPSDASDTSGKSGKGSSGFSKSSKSTSSSSGSSFDDDCYASSKSSKSKAGKSKSSSSSDSETKDSGRSWRAPSDPPTEWKVSSKPTRKPTPSPTSCHERRWRYDSDKGKCSNHPNEVGKDAYEDLQTCCKGHFPEGECEYDDFCADPAPPTPTVAPSYEPTSMAPTYNPTNVPSLRPTRRPTRKPSRRPSRRPTNQPTRDPTARPSMKPTTRPTKERIITTAKPSNTPTDRPSPLSPMTDEPTLSPSTDEPTPSPTDAPTTALPSASPTTPSPTDCEHGRKWHANEDDAKCTNARMPGDSFDVDCDEWDTLTECCEQLFGPGQPCNFDDVCNTFMPTSVPTTSPSASPISPSPTSCEERQFHYAININGSEEQGCTNEPVTNVDIEVYGGDGPIPFYNSVDECCWHEFKTDSCLSYDECAPTTSPSVSPTTPAPTRCEEDRKWWYDADEEKCSNYPIPSSYDWKVWNDMAECCEYEFEEGECSFVDYCNPTPSPTKLPTNRPSRRPSSKPSSQPSRRPTRQPSALPTRHPTPSPTKFPTNRPSRKPSASPTRRPTFRPTRKPSRQPSTPPTFEPTAKPSTLEPTTLAPTTASPSSTPTLSPEVSTSSPSKSPTTGPTASPSASPSSLPSKNPTASPTANPVTSSPTSPAPTTQYPTWMPTTSSCEGRQWYILSTKNGLKQCTNSYDIPAGYDHGLDVYKSKDECCNAEFNDEDCNYLDACEPTASPTTPTSPAPSPAPITPAPTPCESLPWKLLGGQCTNDHESISNDEGHSLYSTVGECCEEEFDGDACVIRDICNSFSPTLSPTPEATQGSTPTVSKETTGPPTRNVPDRGDVWTGDSWGTGGRNGYEDYEDPAHNKCKPAEREACCNQPDHRDEDTKNGICERLGCNMKKCGKRNDDE